MGLLTRVRRFLTGGKTDVRARFELLREAVHGTMSNFHMARDRETGKIVGLKILDREKTESLENRFVGLDKPTEGEIAVQLAHPTIVRTLEHGITSEGEQFLVMEYLEGQGLNTLIREEFTRLDGHRLSLIRQAAEATEAIHQAGFIHRDICPRNLVVGPDLDRLHLIDFGLTVPATAPFQHPGNRTGTPRYMAPEVVRRRATDQRLDVFSFGVTAYELFTGQTPWPAATASGQAAMAHDTHDPVPIENLRPQIHPVLAAAIMRCVASDPEARFASMQAFLAEIAEISAEEV